MAPTGPCEHHRGAHIVPPVSSSDLWGRVHGAPSAAIFHGAHISCRPMAFVSLQGRVCPCTLPPCHSAPPTQGSPAVPPAPSCHTHTQQSSVRFIGVRDGGSYRRRRHAGWCKKAGGGTQRPTGQRHKHSTHGGGLRGDPARAPQPSPPHCACGGTAGPPQPLRRGEGAQGGGDAGATLCPTAAPRRTDKDRHPPHARSTRVFAPCTPGAHPDTRSIAVGASTRTRGPTCAQSRRGRGPQHADTRGHARRTRRRVCIRHICAQGQACASDRCACTEMCTSTPPRSPVSPPRCSTMGRRRRRRRRRKGESSPHPLPPARPGVRPANVGAMSVGTAAVTPVSWGRGPASVGGGPGPVPRCPLTAGVGAVSVQRLRGGQWAGQRAAAWGRLQQQHHVGGRRGTPSTAQLWGHWEAGNLRERAR